MIHNPIINFTVYNIGTDSISLFSLNAQTTLSQLRVKIVQQSGIDNFFFISWGTAIPKPTQTSIFLSNILQRQIITIDTTITQQMMLENIPNPNPQNIQPQIKPQKMLKPKQVLQKIQDDWTCPILQEPIRQPVLTCDGHTYERKAISAWLQNNQTSPRTNLKLQTRELIPNRALNNIMAVCSEYFQQEVKNSQKIQDFLFYSARIAHQQMLFGNQLVQALIEHKKSQPKIQGNSSDIVQFCKEKMYQLLKFQQSHSRLLQKIQTSWIQGHLAFQHDYQHQFNQSKNALLDLKLRHQKDQVMQIMDKKEQKMKEQQQNMVKVIMKQTLDKQIQVQINQIVPKQKIQIDQNPQSNENLQSQNDLSALSIPLNLKKLFDLEQPGQKVQNTSVKQKRIRKTTGNNMKTKKKANKK